MATKGENYSNVPNSGIRHTGYLIEEKGLAHGHNGYLFSGIDLSPKKEEPDARDITATSGSTRSLFDKQLFMFD